MTQPSQTAAALAKQLAKSSTNPTHGLSVPNKDPGSDQEHTIELRAGPATAVEVPPPGDVTSPVKTTSAAPP